MGTKTEGAIRYRFLQYVAIRLAEHYSNLSGQKMPGPLQALIARFYKYEVGFRGDYSIEG